MSVLDIITKHLADTNYNNLPADAVEETKKQTLGMLGVTVAGSTCSLSGEIDALVNMVKEWGGKEESTILAFGGKVPAPQAAFLNGVMCVRRDYDDTNITFNGGHVSRSIIPTAFAMAERLGNISGKDFITAAALGHDLNCRIQFAAPGMSFWYMVNNSFGASATAGKILGLDDEKLRYTLAFAFHQICGASGGGGSDALGSIKGVSNGLTCKSGIISALMAEKGLSVEWDFLDPGNRSNFYETFYGHSYMPEALILDLGKVFMGSSTNQKRYPCCHSQHTSLKTTLEMIKEHNIKPDDVVEVTLGLHSGTKMLAEPLEKKQNPQNTIQAQFSLPWGVASAIVYGDVSIKNFDEGLQDNRVREMARKVSGKPDIESFKAKMFLPAPTAVTIKMKDGKVYSKRNSPPFEQDLLSFPESVAKFKHCCQYSVKPIPEENQDKVIQIVEKLEEVSDVSQIVHLLA